VAPPPTLHVVVEGIGNVVQTYYAPVLRRLIGDYSTQLSVTFIDHSTHWKKQRNADEFQTFIDQLGTWGARYVDKSSSAGKEAYEQLRADVVFIASPDYLHVQLATDWLDSGRCTQIFIEKPIDASLDRARDLLGLVRQNDPRVRALDHYRARMMPVISSTLQFKYIFKELGSRISGFTFYFLEDGSLFKDKKGTCFTDDPIAALGRSKSLESGLILDMMPHVPAVLSNFGIVDSIRVLGVRVGRYKYIDKKGREQEASIPKETFAHIRFSFRGFDLLPITGDVYLGKGIKGSSDLQKTGDIKLLDLIGANGNTFRFDLRGSQEGGNVVLIDKKKEERFFLKLIPDAYGTIIRLVVEDKLKASDGQLFFDMPLELAKNIRLAIEEMLHPIKGKVIPTYHISAPINGTSGAPYLEELVRTITPVQEFLE